MYYNSNSGILRSHDEMLKKATFHATGRIGKATFKLDCVDISRFNKQLDLYRSMDAFDILVVIGDTEEKGS